MDYVETYDAVIRAKRSTRDKRAIGAVLTTILGAAAGVVLTKMFDKFTGGESEEIRDEMIRNQISVLEIVHEEITEIGQHEGMQWAATYTLTALIGFHERQQIILEMLESKNNQL